MKTYLFIALSDISKALIDLLNHSLCQIVVASRAFDSQPAYKTIRLDLNDPNCFEKIVAEISMEHLTVINAIGLLHNAHGQPEKSLHQLDSDWFMESMQVNCLSHIRCLKALSEKMTRQSRVTYIGFSARVGSISDNRLGGWMSYRTSKAALNMALKTASIEWRFKFPESCIVAYHPGTVATRLSAPFNSRVSDIFTPKQAADKLLQFMQTISSEKSGFLFDWRQEKIMF